VAEVTSEVGADPSATASAVVTEGATPDVPTSVAGPVRSSRLPRFLSEPMWVLGLVILMDEIDKDIVRGMITPLKEEFGVGDLGISVWPPART
jgi:hypothetical protein